MPGKQLHPAVVGLRLRTTVVMPVSTIDLAELHPALVAGEQRQQRLAPLHSTVREVLEHGPPSSRSERQSTSTR